MPIEIITRQITPNGATPNVAEFTFSTAPQSYVTGINAFELCFSDNAEHYVQAANISLNSTLSGSTVTVTASLDFIGSGYGIDVDQSFVWVTVIASIGSTPGVYLGTWKTGDPQFMTAPINPVNGCQGFLGGFTAGYGSSYAVSQFGVQAIAFHPGDAVRSFGTTTVYEHQYAPNQLQVLAGTTLTDNDGDVAASTIVANFCCSDGYNSGMGNDSIHLASFGEQYNNNYQDFTDGPSGFPDPPALRATKAATYTPTRKLSQVAVLIQTLDLLFDTATSREISVIRAGCLTYSNRVGETDQNAFQYQVTIQDNWQITFEYQAVMFRWAEGLNDFHNSLSNTIEFAIIGVPA